MSSLERGQRNSSGQDTAVSSISKEEDFAIFLIVVACLNADRASCNWSIVWTLKPSSSSMLLRSFFISRFSSLALAIAVGSESKNPVFAISVGSTAGSHQTLLEDYVAESFELISLIKSFFFWFLLFSVTKRVIIINMRREGEEGSVVPLWPPKSPRHYSVVIINNYYIQFKTKLDLDPHNCAGINFHVYIYILHN